MPNKLVLTQNCRNPKHKHTQIFNWAVGSCIIVGDCVRCQVLSKKKKAFDNRKMISVVLLNTKEEKASIMRLKML